MKNLTEQELKKVQEYSDWLKSGGDVLEFKFSPYEKRYDVKTPEGVEFTIWNQKGLELFICYKRGRISPDDSFEGRVLCGRKVPCTQDHNCDDHDHLDYFKPIAESLYRKWMFKKLCGGVFEC